MVLFRLTILFSGLLAAVPARADVTVRYDPEPPSTLGLVIEADDQGHVRAVGSGGVDLIFRDGEVFIFQATPDGPAVARLDDVLALATEARATSGVARMFAPHRMQVEYRPHGTQRVGDRDGDLFQAIEIPERADGEPGEIVVSRDPELRRWAGAVSQVLDVQTRMISAVLGVGEDEESRRAGNALTESGLMLRIGHLYRLVGIDTASIAPDRFALPGPILTREQLRALHAD